MCRFKYIYYVIIACYFPFALLACDSNKPRETKSVEPWQPKSFSELRYFDEITPLADGGAYVAGGGSLWYLRGGEAVRVKEVSQITGHSTSQLHTKKEKALWALWQHERAKRITAAAQAEENQPDEVDYSDNYEPF